MMGSIVHRGAMRELANDEELQTRFAWFIDGEPPIIYGLFFS